MYLNIFLYTIIYIKIYLNMCVYLFIQYIYQYIFSTHEPYLLVWLVQVPISVQILFFFFHLILNVNKIPVKFMISNVSYGGYRSAIVIKWKHEGWRFGRQSRGLHRHHRSPSLSSSVAENSSCNIHTEFECGNGECIDYQLTCDGIAHCKDKSDEKMQYCGE